MIMRAPSSPEAQPRRGMSGKSAIGASPRPGAHEARAPATRPAAGAPPFAAPAPRVPLAAPRPATTRSPGGDGGPAPVQATSAPRPALGTQGSVSKPNAMAPAARLGHPRPPETAPSPSPEDRTMIMRDAPPRPAPGPAPETGPGRGVQALRTAQPVQPSYAGRAPGFSQRQGPAIQRTVTAQPQLAPTSQLAQRAQLAQQAQQRAPTSRTTNNQPLAPGSIAATAQAPSRSGTQPPPAQTPYAPAPTMPAASMQTPPLQEAMQRPLMHQGPSYPATAHGPRMLPRPPQFPDPRSSQGVLQPGPAMFVPQAPIALPRPMPAPPSAFPSHFARSMQGAPPVATPRASMTALIALSARTELGIDADPVPMPMTAMPPAEPGAIMAASVLLGLPLALATVVVAMLALR